ncbi:hypothetical protein CLHUN_29830 [Ruminiclostridium hungatei]|uniref:Uncharacterized protein n=1 Tax=Ruminiclostridium hungatei TaxID=48256 RepID=A0A1V4SGW8_RUMHU|nr:hypothetical protein CLHUN_29830 [Ruminiclostridium hungatei]
MFYVIWLILTSVLSVLGIVRFKPHYHNDDMASPLLTDITTVTVFLPCYFILLWLLIHIVYAHVNSLKIKAALISFFSISGFLLSLLFLDFYSLTFRTLISFVLMTVTFIYFYITAFIYRKSNFFRKN